MQTVTVDLASYQRETDRIRRLDERIAELEAAILKSLSHADANGMSEWPAFKALRKAVEA